MRMAETPKPLDLKPETVLFYKGYVREAEATMEGTLGDADGSFLWADNDPKILEQVRRGDVPAQSLAAKGSVAAPSGVIHDWIAAAFVPDATVAGLIGRLQDYDNHKDIYTDVIESKLISRKGNDFKIYLRLLKKKIITIVLDTDHDVHYTQLDDARWCLRSCTTRIAEVDNPGRPTENVRPADTGFGYLWRLYSYWRFFERDAGVYLECRAISLTRDIPAGLGWIVQPILRSLPKEALISTLKNTCDAALLAGIEP